METIKINNHEIASLYGHVPGNRLSAAIKRNYSREAPSGEVLNLDRYANDILTMPLSLCFITGVTNDDFVIFSTLITTVDQLAFYNKEDDFTVIKPTSPEGVIDFFTKLQGFDTLIETGTSLVLSEDALLTFMALLDLIKRNQMEQLLFSTYDTPEFSVSNLKEIYSLSLDTGDLRWALPFVMEALGPFKNRDAETGPSFNKGIGELQDIGLLSVSGDIFRLMDKGFEFISIFLKPKSMLGLSSIFYEKEILSHLPIAFINSGQFMYYIMPSDPEGTFVFKSIDSGTYKEFLEMIIAAGYEPPLATELQQPGEPLEIKLPPGQDESKVTVEVQDEIPLKFCKYCGAKIRASAKFCSKCGKSLIN